MRLGFLCTAAAAAVGVTCTSVSAFTPPAFYYWGVARKSPGTSRLSNAFDTPSSNDVDNAEELSLDPSTFGRTLRSAKVTNADGQLVALGNAMGQEGTAATTSVVIFLRHLG